MRKFLLYTLLAVVAIILLNIVVNSFHPLNKSEEKIKESILKLAPIGTSMDDILELIESNEKWKNCRVDYERGVWFAELGRRNEPADIALNKETVIGVKSIRVIIGKYQSFFQVLVDVHFAFDENAKLIDVFVRKESQGF